MDEDNLIYLYRRTDYNQGYPFDLGEDESPFGKIKAYHHMNYVFAWRDYPELDDSLLEAIIKKRDEGYIIVVGVDPRFPEDKEIDMEGDCEIYDTHPELGQFLKKHGIPFKDTKEALPTLNEVIEKLLREWVEEA